MKSANRFRRLFLLPILFALCTATGLYTALISDGWGDVVSWITLLVPSYYSIHLLRRAFSQNQLPK